MIRLENFPKRKKIVYFSLWENEGVLQEDLEI